MFNTQSNVMEGRLIQFYDNIKFIGVNLIDNIATQVTQIEDKLDKRLDNATNWITPMFKGKGTKLASFELTKRSESFNDRGYFQGSYFPKICINMRNRYSEVDMINLIRLTPLKGLPKWSIIFPFKELQMIGWNLELGYYNWILKDGNDSSGIRNPMVAIFHGSNL